MPMPGRPALLKDVLSVPPVARLDVGIAPNRPQSANCARNRAQCRSRFRRPENARPAQPPRTGVHVVTQRTNELGVRVALGAQRAQIFHLVLLDGLRPALLGLIVGLAGSAVVAKLIRSLLYGIEPYDSTVFLSVITILLAVAAFACTIPAWRPSRLDPLQALRVE
jgi:hypothetical protein